MRRSDAERLEALLGAYPPDLRGALGPAGDGCVGALLAEKRVAAALAETEATEAAFVAFIARLGGEVSPGTADWWLRRRQVTDPDACVERLAGRGLLFYLPAGGAAPGPGGGLEGARGLRVAGKLWVPQAIGQSALESHPLPHLTSVPEPARITPGQPWEVVRRLFILRRQGAERRAVGLPRLRSGRAGPAPGLPERLGGAGASDDEWLSALNAGLAAGMAVFELPPRAQRRALLEAAVTQTVWGELERAPGLALDVPATTAPGRSDVPSVGHRVRARRHLLRVLAATATPGQWHSLAELAERAMEAGPDFLIRRRPPGAEPVYRGIRRSRPDGAEPLGMTEDWRLVEGAFVAEFARGSLLWLGLVDLAGPREADAFRLTEAGAEALSAEGGEPEARPPGRFFVQPNFEIMADGGGDNVAAVVRLSRVAELESFDRAALLKITRESVLRGLEAGLAGEQVLGILSDEGRVAVPQNVEYSIGEWAAAHDRYELRTGASVLEVEEPAELDALEAALPDCLQRLGPTAARVLPERLAQVEAALALRIDVVHIDHAEGLSGVFRLDDQMLVTPLPERWHWYPEHLLAQIGERHEGSHAGEQEPGGTATADGTAWFRLTRESVRGALERGLRAEEVERLVEACADRELTPRQRLQLRGWLGRYDTAHLSNATVLALPPEAVADALAIPELRAQVVGWISPAVFVIRPRGRAAVRRLLEEAGIEVGEGLGFSPLDGPAAERSRELGDEPALPRRAWGRRRWARGEEEAERLAVVEEAVARGLRLRIGYASVVRGEPPRHWEVTPHRLERSRWGQVRLQAYCHAREAERVFEIERVTEIHVLGPQAGRANGTMPA
jgi:hypothetical protein